MKKICGAFIASIYMMIVLFSAGTLKAEAANTTSGTLGFNDGITWTYDADTKTLIVSGNDGGLDGTHYKSPFADISDDIEVIIMKDCTLRDSTASLFANLESLKRIEFDNFNTSDITYMKRMFYNCTSLESLDLSNLDTSNVTNMYGMFEGCSSLVSLDVSGFDTSKVEDMTNMFYGCESLTSLDLSNFNTSNVEYMHGMFEGCKSLVSLDLCNFDTSKVTYMTSMFYDCNSLSNLDVSKFNTSNVESMSYMFTRCSSLTDLDLSSFELSAVREVEFILSRCDNLMVIYTPKDIPSKVSIELPATFRNLMRKQTTFLTKEFRDTVLLHVDYALEGVELDASSLSILKGRSGQLNATVFPLNAPIKEITWSTSDRYVARVDENGKVTAVNSGTAHITVRVTDITGEYKEAICEVKVLIPVKNISLNPKTLNLKSGDKYTLKVTVGPDDASVRDVTWTTSDKSVAKVDEYGTISAVLPGTAIITATATDGSGVSASCEVTVTQPVIHIGIDDWLDMNVGESETLTLYINPDNASNKEVLWSIENPGTQVATVDSNGTVTALGVGKAIVTVRTTDGSNLSASCTVSVKDPLAEQRKLIRAFVERMYTVALGRAAETEGLNFYVQRLLSGDSNGACIAESFLCSPEFLNKGHSDAEYVKVLYRTFFDREPAAEEVNYWVDKLSNGQTKAFVLSGFVNSYEFDNLCAQYGISRGFMREDGKPLNPGIGRFAERMYTVVLERAGEKEGIEYWSLSIANGVCTPKDAAKSFFLSQEYINKNTSDAQYITTLYKAFMDREPEAGGVEYWQNVLKNGATREQILEGFADSAEFKGIMASFGL